MGSPRRPSRSTDPRESLEARRARLGRILAHLRRLHGDADCALDHRSALELLVATILSAQCTDERVNRVTPDLFRRFPAVDDYADADLEELEERIRSTGFFRNKARAIRDLGRALRERHAGEVPDRMDDLHALPGVGRKTANVVLGTWFGIPAIPVDTHVKRLVGRLDLTDEVDPVKIEFALQELAPDRDWTFLSHALIWHGRRICLARKPACDRCALAPECPFPGREDA